MTEMFLTAAESFLLPEKLRKQTVVFAWLFVMVVLWGLSWPATQMALETVPPLWLATIRFGSGGLCLFAFVAIRGKLSLPRKGDWLIVCSVGLLQMMAFTGLGMIAMTYTDTSHSVLLAYSTPLWSVLMSWLLLRQAPRKIQFLALAVGLFGVALIVSPWEMDWQREGTVMGAFFLIGGAICWSCVILHVRHHRWVSSPLALAPWQMVLATIPLAIVAFIVDGSPAQILFSPRLGLLIAFIGPIATSLCFVISSEYGRRITPFAMSNLTLGVPLIGIVSSVFLLENHLSPLFLVGLAMVFVGMLLAGVASRRSSRSS